MFQEKCCIRVLPHDRSVDAGELWGDSFANGVLLWESGIKKNHVKAHQLQYLECHKATGVNAEVYPKRKRRSSHLVPTQF